MPPSQTNATQLSTEAGPSPATPSKPASNTTSTPQSNKISGSQTYAVRDLDLIARRVQLARETNRRFAGPMLWKDFLDKFLPESESLDGPENSQISSPVDFNPLHGAKTEEERCKMFASSLFLDTIRSKVPLLKSTNSSNHEDPGINLKHDICMYPHDFVIPDNKPTDLSEMEFWIEFKHDPNQDTFPRPGDKEPADKGFENRIQMPDYATASMGLQFRTHLLSIFICGNYARLLRWDREGAVFTERIDCTQDAAPIMEFFHRYSNATSKQRRFDPTVSKPSDDEFKAAESGFKQHDLDCTRFLKVDIPSRTTTTTSSDRSTHVEIGLAGKYIIPVSATTRSPFGPTRSSVAFNLETKTVVYYKDNRRPDFEDRKITPEGEIYQCLRDNNVNHIVPFEHGGDMWDNASRSQEFSKDCLSCPKSQILRYVNYRMALRVVGTPLSTFESERELFQVVADAMEGHDEAFTKAGVLHTDISPGNILIARKEDGTFEGLLIDWDLCSPIEESADGPRRSARTGTWQFISCYLLKEPNPTHTIMDDRESALHLLTWLVLRHVKHNISPEKTTSLLAAFNEVRWNYEGVVTGGLQKRSNLIEGYQVPSELVFEDEDVRHLKGLIDDLAAIFAVRYRGLPSAQDAEDLQDLQDLFKDQPAVLELCTVGHVSHIYHTNMTLLKESGWLVKTLRDHIASHEWPEADGARHLSMPARLSRPAQSCSRPVKFV
ncbi:hypothetical protein FIBSPDRAFT_928568 [Athelia psychrophila]|uniref:Fungal-type protein kinase domain-containing protein n=1 Tax=Athelia psychrophila TaxID=1759441 RepID=A0A166Q047_9AGAM|nr:hypothetical protein FIBSPDRAFT_928568 [Fibularhizoctonia sp. CBS 109695]